MLILTCPNCGDRNVSEFRFNGEYIPRPEDPSACSNSDWTDYLYIRTNSMNIQIEWWYHNAGCELWFLAERNTLTNRVVKTYLWQPNFTVGEA